MLYFKFLQISLVTRMNLILNNAGYPGRQKSNKRRHNVKLVIEFVCYNQ